MMAVNFPDAFRFLQALDPAVSFTFQTFDDNGERKDKRLARIFHGTLEAHAGALAALNGEGAGIFVCVNRTDSKGRKASNITAVRALFIDHDVVNHQRDFSTYDVPPSVVVESSPGKHHVYWVVRKFAMERFAPAQKRLAAAFGGDPAVHDLPRVMRLPGFYHRKGEPFLSRVIQCAGVVYDGA